MASCGTTSADVPSPPAIDPLRRPSLTHRPQRALWCRQAGPFHPTAATTRVACLLHNRSGGPFQANDGAIASEWHSSAPTGGTSAEYERRRARPNAIAVPARAVSDSAALSSPLAVAPHVSTVPTTRAPLQSGVPVSGSHLPYNYRARRPIECARPAGSGDVGARGVAVATLMSFAADVQLARTVVDGPRPARKPPRPSSSTPRSPREVRPRCGHW